METRLKKRKCKDNFKLLNEKLEEAYSTVGSKISEIVKKERARIKKESKFPINYKFKIELK